MLYQDNALEISSSVREKLDQTNNVGYEIVPQQGNVYMVVVCRSGFDDYIETVRNITKIYENRDSMYSRYQMGMLALTVLVGGIILVVLFFVMRGMQKLSKAVRASSQAENTTCAFIFEAMMRWDAWRRISTGWRVK